MVKGEQVSKMRRSPQIEFSRQSGLHGQTARYFDELSVGRAVQVTPASGTVPPPVRPHSPAARAAHVFEDSFHSCVALQIDLDMAPPTGHGGLVPHGEPSDLAWV